MAFVLQKNVKGYRYYQLVRNYREQGKHRQEVIKHLGPHDSLEGAILATKRALGSILERQVYWVDRSERAADIALKSAKRDYHFSRESAELLGAAEARAFART
jgi:hypothetical protein